MLPPTITEAIIAELRPAYLGRTPEDAAHAVVYQLGLLGLRDIGPDNPQVRLMASAIVSGVPF